MSLTLEKHEVFTFSEMSRVLQRPQTGVAWSQRTLDIRQGSHDVAFPFRRYIESGV
jgi:hypothetical protein